MSEFLGLAPDVKLGRCQAVRRQKRQGSTTGTRPRTTAKPPGLLRLVTTSQSLTMRTRHKLTYITQPKQPNCTSSTTDKKRTKKEQVNEKMAMYLSLVLGALLKSLTVAAAALNAGMALIKYRTVARCYRLNLGLRDLARAAEHLAVWLGVKVFAACLLTARAVFHMLLEASAEVGEWSMRRSPAVQERIPSLFVVR